MSAEDELVALLRAQEARRRRRNRVLAWVAVALVLAAIAAVPVVRHIQQEREDARTHSRIVCATFYEYGSGAYNACLAD